VLEKDGADEENVELAPIEGQHDAGHHQHLEQIEVPVIDTVALAITVPVVGPAEVKDEEDRNTIGEGSQAISPLIRRAPPGKLALPAT
jgi:hypothetical protein